MKLKNKAVIKLHSNDDVTLIYVAIESLVENITKFVCLDHNLDAQNDVIKLLIIMEGLHETKKKKSKIRKAKKR